MLPISRRQIFGLLAGFLAPQMRMGIDPRTQSQASPHAVPRFSRSSSSDLHPLAAEPYAVTTHAFIPDSDPTDPSALEAWRRLPMLPVIDFKGFSSAAHTELLFLGRVILERIESQTDFAFRYHGGSDPGADRRVLPILLFRKFEMTYAVDEHSHLYLLAHCHTRQQARTFRLDRIHPL